MVNKPTHLALTDSIRFIVNDKRGRAFLQWLFTQCNVEGAMSEQTFQWQESRRTLGRKLYALIEECFDSHTIVNIKEEKHE